MKVNKIDLANELLTLTKEIEAHLEKSDLAYATENEQRRMELAKQVFSDELTEEESPKIIEIINEVLEVNTRLQNYAKKAKDQVANMSRDIRKAKKAKSAYQDHR